MQICKIEGKWRLNSYIFSVSRVERQRQEKFKIKRQRKNENKDKEKMKNLFKDKEKMAIWGKIIHLIQCFSNRADIGIKKGWNFIVYRSLQGCFNILISFRKQVHRKYVFKGVK